MAKTTKISWADHSWSPWRVCTKVSPGCDNCFAEALAKRAGLGWGKGVPRQRTSVAYWRQPLRWNREAEEAGVRRRVFPSQCDPFDTEAPADWREDMFALIEATPWLDWLLLTKRPAEAVRELTRIWNEENAPRNIWLGTSIEDQDHVFRLEHLLAAPSWVVILFLSVEPMLGPILFPLGSLKAMDWVIIGAESGPKRRPFDNAWALDVVAQCDEAEVPVWCKQG